MLRADAPYTIRALAFYPPVLRRLQAWYGIFRWFLRARWFLQLPVGFCRHWVVSAGTVVSAGNFGYASPGPKGTATITLVVSAGNFGYASPCYFWYLLARK
jgi:hypothetical protein